MIQWLSGDDAVKAYHKENPSDPGPPPNDYFIVNASRKVYSIPVAAGATVWLVRLQEDSNADLSPGTWEELPTYLQKYRPGPGGVGLSSNPFWLTVVNGAVAEICEQYVP